LALPTSKNSEFDISTIWMLSPESVILISTCFMICSKCSMPDSCSRSSSAASSSSRLACSCMPSMIPWPASGRIDWPPSGPPAPEALKAPGSRK